MKHARLILATPRGFCAGVHRAIEIVERALELFGPPIYVRHEVVHNRFVVEGLRQRGAVFVNELDEVPDGTTVIFSAHGVSRAVENEAMQRNLQVFDATCPLVTKVHLEVVRHARAGLDCILIGHPGHPEVEGTLGRFESHDGNRIYLVSSAEEADQIEVERPQQLAYVTQTTLSVDDTRRIVERLRRRFPTLIGPRKDDICYATQNRQDAVRQLAERCDCILIIGSPNSSNSNRLREVAEQHGTRARLIDCPDELERGWFADCERVGISAGASAPETLVEALLTRMQEWGAEMEDAPQAGRQEEIVFPIPVELRASR